MKALVLLARVLAVLCAVGLVGTFVRANSLTAKAELTQRIKPYDKDTAALTGDVGTPIGDSQDMIIDDPAAFLPGKGDKGQRLVNDDYLQQHEIYPLQAKTVNYVAGLAKLGFAGGLVLAVSAGLFASRRLATRTA